MAIVEGQIIKVKWNGRNRKMYEQLKDVNGNQKYHFTGSGDEFIIDIDDIARTSKIEIKLTCDYCNMPFKRKYFDFRKGRDNSDIKRDSCQKCKGLKRREENGTLNEPDYVTPAPIQVSLTKEFLINEFNRYHEEFGTYPMKTEINAHPDYPSSSVYVSNWGTWGIFLETIGVTDESGWYICDLNVIRSIYEKANNLSEINNKLMKKRSIKEINDKAKEFGFKIKSFVNRKHYDVSNKENKLQSSIDGLVDLSVDLGRCPGITEYNEYAKINGLYHGREFTNLTGNRYSEMCSQYINYSNKDTKTNEQLITELKKLKEKIGRVPKGCELKSYGLAERKTYMRRFKMTYQELIESLGWENLTAKKTRRSSEEMLNDLQILYIKLGRVPNYNDIDNEPNMATYSSYKFKFGSLKNALNNINITESEVNQDSSMGNVCLNKKGEICRSTPELIISNFMIDNNIKYTPEIKYRDLDENIKKLWKMDWYLPEQKTYVEYFGLFQISDVKRNNRIGKYTRKAIEKINYCNSKNIKLISFYKEDLNISNYNEVLYGKFSDVIDNIRV